MKKYREIPEGTEIEAWIYPYYRECVFKNGVWTTTSENAERFLGPQLQVQLTLMWVDGIKSEKGVKN